jgi:hypothetical protein
MEWTHITEVKSLKLSLAAYLNIWCDHQADNARKKNASFPNADALPAEKWAVFSSYPVTRKVIRKLDIGIHESIYTEALLDYIHKKHNICNTKLNTINTEGVKSYLGRQQYIQ